MSAWYLWVRRLLSIVSVSTSLSLQARKHADLISRCHFEPSYEATVVGNKPWSLTSAAGGLIIPSHFAA
jgi:hypothetical protein